MPYTPERTDEEVALAVQKGDTESFGLLIERYEAKISRYARKFLSDGDDRKDLVQDIFMKAYANIQSFNTLKRFSPWIYRIAHNEFVNALKKKPRIPFISFEGFEADVLLPFPHPIAKENAEDRANDAEIRRLLDEELGKMDKKYREVLILYYFEEMGYKEIADILQIPTTTVGVRITRGKALLRKAARLKEFKNT